MTEEEKKQRMMAKAMRGTTSGMNGPPQEFSSINPQPTDEFTAIPISKMKDFDIKVAPRRKEKSISENPQVQAAPESPMVPDLSNTDGGTTKINNTASVKKKRWWE